jgi:RIO-like serine/threonine protein kinase
MNKSRRLVITIIHKKKGYNVFKNDNKIQIYKDVYDTNMFTGLKKLDDFQKLNILREIIFFSKEMLDKNYYHLDLNLYNILLNFNNEIFFNDFKNIQKEENKKTDYFYFDSDYEFMDVLFRPPETFNDIFNEKSIVYLIGIDNY